MDESILNEVKKALGILPDYDAFDTEIIMHINSVFATLHQLGIGPSEGFYLADATSTWFDFLGNDPHFNSVKTYVFLKVRIIFDPPATSYLIESLRKQAQEFEWRLNITREGKAWDDPTDPLTVDGGYA